MVCILFAVISACICQISGAGYYWQYFPQNADLLQPVFTINQKQVVSALDCNKEIMSPETSGSESNSESKETNEESKSESEEGSESKPESGEKSSSSDESGSKESKSESSSASGETSEAESSSSEENKSSQESNTSEESKESAESSESSDSTDSGSDESDSTKESKEVNKFKTPTGFLFPKRGKTKLKPTYGSNFGKNVQPVYYGQNYPLAYYNGYSKGATNQYVSYVIPPSQYVRQRYVTASRLNNYRPISKGTGFQYNYVPQSSYRLRNYGSSPIYVLRKRPVISGKSGVVNNWRLGQLGSYITVK